jgi:L-threonylcarbamoyladenylate synthase
METKILQASQIDEAVGLLKNGEVVALPTETVYGLAADSKNDIAINKIFISKGRPSDHPLILHISDLSQIHDYAVNIPPSAYKLANAFWPGPLTMILNKKDGVSALITGNLNTIAVRVPNHPLIQKIIDKLGHGIVAPSANTHKKTSPTKIEHVLKNLDGKIAAVLDGGSCNVGIESTIIDMTKETPLILRPGAITQTMIEEVLNAKIAMPLNHSEKTPGNMVVHYQPQKPLYLCSINEITAQLEKETLVAIMHYSKIARHEKNAHYYEMPKEKSEYATQLYDMLYKIDATHVKKILVEAPPLLSEWADVNDRLLKASTKK